MVGFLNICKPIDCTSASVVGKVKKISKFKKIGHTGTLDPLACGVLPVAINSATKFIQFLQDDKDYIALLKLGIITNTGDITGDIISENAVPLLKTSEIENTVNDFVGEIFQIPHMFSALKHNGKRLYQLARQGKIVEREKRRIKIYKMEVVSFNPPDEICLFISCSAGTYIRSLVEDIGQKLGCGATLSFLLRTRVGIFNIHNSVKIDRLGKYPSQQISAISNYIGLDFENLPVINSEKIANFIIPIENSFPNIPTAVIKDSSLTIVKNGGMLKKEDLMHYTEELKSGILIKICHNNNMLAMYQVMENKDLDSSLDRIYLKPIRVQC